MPPCSTTAHHIPAAYVSRMQRRIRGGLPLLPRFRAFVRRRTAHGLSFVPSVAVHPRFPHTLSPASASFAPCVYSAVYILYTSNTRYLSSHFVPGSESNGKD